MARFDGMGPRGQGTGGLGRGSNCQGQGQGQGLGRGLGQQQCLRSEGFSGMGNRVGATRNRGFFGSCVEGLQAKIEAMQARLEALKSQGRS